MSNNGWIGVDLDGTLAFYDQGQWPGIGKPIPLMLERVKTWVAAGRDVRIVTARVDGAATALTAWQPAPAINREEHVAAIQAWLVKHVGKALPVTCSKDYNMIELWDDRAVQVIPNTGQTLADELTAIRSALSGKVAAPA